MSRNFRLYRASLDVLKDGIAQEKAIALGRMGPGQQARRLMTEAVGALWMFVVQREVCGLRESRSVMRDL